MPAAYDPYDTGQYDMVSTMLVKDVGDDSHYIYIFLSLFPCFGYGKTWFAYKPDRSLTFQVSP